MSGRLGALDLAAATNTLLYTCPSATVATVNINICNRNTEPATIRIAFLDGAIGTLADEDYIEYDLSMCNNNVVERTGLVMSEGQTIVVYSDIVDVTAQVWGWEETE